MLCVCVTVKARQLLRDDPPLTVCFSSNALRATARAQRIAEEEPLTKPATVSEGKPNKSTIYFSQMSSSFDAMGDIT